MKSRVRQARLHLPDERRRRDRDQFSKSPFESDHPLRLETGDRAGIEIVLSVDDVEDAYRTATESGWPKLAEEALGTKIMVTPHVLRHTFACLFIESTISDRAKEDGFDPEKLTQKQVEDYGSEALVVLQKLLGHALPKDTLRYLRQLSLGRIGLRYLEFFSAAMQEVLGPDATF